MKYILICIVAFSFFSCRDKSKSKAAENLKAAQDTDVHVDSKKKVILNNRY